MTRISFLKLNEKLKKEGKNELANPRNGVAGSIRQLDPKVTRERNLSFYAYEIIIPGFDIKKHEVIKRKSVITKFFKD